MTAPILLPVSLWNHAALRWAAILAFGIFVPSSALGAMEVQAAESPAVTSESLARIAPAMDALISANRLPGTITAVWYRGHLAHFSTLGVRDLATSAPMAQDTIFRIYSMTKPFIAVAAMILVEDGQLGLDDPVEKYLPEIAGMGVYQPGNTTGTVTANADYTTAPVTRPMTVRDLLRHTSGLTYGYTDATPVDAMYKRVAILDRRGSLQAMVAKLARLPLRFQPGERWHYGLSSDVLGRVVEVASGEPLDKFCRERIFDPLGMPDSGFDVPGEKQKRLAAIYSRNGAGTLVPWGGSIETTTYYPPVTFFSGGGGGVSTVPDYMRFAQMLLNGGSLETTRILSRQSVDLMTTNALTTGDYRPGWGFGFGMQVCTSPTLARTASGIGTYGWAGGGNTYFFVDPANGLIAMAFSQVSGSTGLSEAFRGALYARPVPTAPNRSGTEP